MSNFKEIFFVQFFYIFIFLVHSLKGMEETEESEKFRERMSSGRRGGTPERRNLRTGSGRLHAGGRGPSTPLDDPKLFRSSILFFIFFSLAL